MTDPTSDVPLPMKGLISEAGWARLASCVGQPPSGWTARAVAHPLGRATNGLFHVSRSADTDDAGYLVKLFRGETHDRAAEQIAGHWAAMRRLEGHRSARVPALLGMVPEEDALLMSYVPGVSLHIALLATSDRAERLEAVARCAAWLRQNADAADGRIAPLPIGSFAQRLTRIQRDAAKTRTAIWRPDAFDHLVDLAKDALGRMPEHGFAFGARHGDANPGNFILHPDGSVYGLDLLRPVLQPLCQDLAYLLVQTLPVLPFADDMPHIASRLCAAAQVRPGMDVATTACLYIEILGVWRRLPPAQFETDKEMPRFIRSLVDADALADLRL